MDLNTRLKTAMNLLIHSRGGICEAADIVGRSSNYLYRMSSPTEDVPMPIDVVVTLMRHRNDYSILRMIANDCGHALVKLPKVGLKRGDETEIAAEYNHVLSSAGKSVIAFFNKPTPANYDTAAKALNAVITESIGVKRTVDKKHSRQMELEFNG